MLVALQDDRSFMFVRNNTVELISTINKSDNSSRTNDSYEDEVGGRGRSALSRCALLVGLMKVDD